MNETKKPAVRFKGFSVEWERHPMDELTTELHEYATLDSLYPLLTSSREGIMFQNEYRSNRTTENNKTLFSIVPYGKCTYRHMSDDDIFHFNINDIVENGLVSREYPVFDSTDDNELRFIVALLNSSEQFRKFCRERKIGGTRTRLYYKDLSNFKPLCPEFNEQRNIAEFLDGITSIISYHQSKLEKLQSLKASMLEKMFPKNGSDVPDIRFKGFTKAWIKRKIGECFAERNESFPDGELLSVTINNGVSAIEDLDILDDIEVLRDTLEVPSFARKLSKVKKASPIFKLGISKEAIVEFTKNTPELAGKFKYSEDGTQIRLGTKKSKIAFLKLMNDAFLHSELTKQWYDASAKDNITQGAG